MTAVQKIFPVTLAVSGTKSEIVNLEGYTLVGVRFPTNTTATTFTINSGTDIEYPTGDSGASNQIAVSSLSSSLSPVKTAAGGDITLSVSSPPNVISVDPVDFYGFNYIEVEGNTAQLTNPVVIQLIAVCI